MPKETCPRHGCVLKKNTCPECDRHGDPTPFSVRSDEDRVMHSETADPAAVRMRAALEAIREALNEGEHRPMKGYHQARALADEWGLYNDDLEGSRLLYLLASAALGL